jgi:hypothetical protein
MTEQMQLSAEEAHERVESGKALPACATKMLQEGAAVRIDISARV